MQEAYSHEVSSCGFWPGNGGYDRAAFYSYAYPEPPDWSGPFGRMRRSMTRIWGNSSCPMTRSAVLRHRMKV